MEILENRTAWSTEFKSGWLKHYNETGTIDWSLYNRPKNKSAPGLPGIDLSQTRLAFITTAGAYLKNGQQPFDAANDLGDYTVRILPAHTHFDEIAYAHDHYDHTAVNADPQVLMPLRHLETLVDEGVIGEIAPEVISFMGYQPDVTRVIDDLFPKILDTVLAGRAKGALLVPA